MSHEDSVKKYLELQDSGQVEPLLAMLTDDVVLVYPMGTSNGKAQVEQALRSRPGAMKPEYGDITVDGDKAKVAGKLPPGMMISSVNLAFELAGASNAEFVLLKIDYGVGALRVRRRDAVAIPDLTGQLAGERFGYLYDNMSRLPIMEYPQGRQWILDRL